MIVYKQMFNLIGIVNIINEWILKKNSYLKEIQEAHTDWNVSW